MKKCLSLILALALITAMIPLSVVTASAADDVYNITVETVGNGTVSVSPSSAAENEYVTVTMTAGEGWYVREMTVNTEEIQISKITYNSATFEEDVDGFTMPGEDVVLRVTFALPEAFDNTQPEPNPHEPGDMCEITFDANGGEGQMERASVLYGDSLELPDCGFEKTDRVFYRWKAFGALYEAGETVTVLDDAVIEAIWSYGDQTYTNDYSTDDSSTEVKGILKLTDTRTGEVTERMIWNSNHYSALNEPMTKNVSDAVEDAKTELQLAANGYNEVSVGALTVSDPVVADSWNDCENEYYDYGEPTGIDEEGDYYSKALFVEGSFGKLWQITVTLEAEYVSVPMSYIHVLNSEGGFVNFWCEDYNGDYTQPYDVPEGAEVTLSAVPDSGYVFKGWYKGDVNASSYNEMFTDELITTENPYVFNAYNYPYICAKFEYTGVERQGDQIQVWITDGGKASVQYTPTWTDDAYIKPKDGNDYVSIGEVVTLWRGDAITVNAKPSMGYVFKGWYHVNIEWGPGGGKKYEGEPIALTESYTYKPAVTVVDGDADPLRYICAVFEPSGEPIIGDVNGDGVINVNDVTEIQRIVAEFIVPSETQRITADVNGDEAVNMDDATLLQRYLAEFDGAEIRSE